MFDGLKKDCRFCDIVARDKRAEIVYEDMTFLGFLDNKPVNYGHTLLIPKYHYPNLQDAPQEIVRDIFLTSVGIMPYIKRAMQADNVVLSVVGTDVPHLHVHLLPRYHDDGLKDFWPSKEYEEGLEEIVGEEIRKEIDGRLL